VIGRFLDELPYAARSLARTPAWTAGLVLTLALGIGSSASVDGFVRGLTGNQLAAAPATRPDAAAGLAAIAQLLWISASAIFLIACANVASFLLARATARARETAVRVAIGAGRAQLFRQVLADSVVLSIAGAIMGSIFAVWIGRIVPALLFDQDADQMIFAAAPARVMLTALICAAVTMACGMLPLMEMRHDNPGAIMQREIAGPSRRTVRLGHALVIVQMTACTLLVVSTGLLLAGFQSALQTSAGRRLSEPIVVSVEGLQMSSEAQEANAGREYFAAVARAAAEVAGATTSAWTANVPGNRPNWRRFYVEAAAQPRRIIELQPVPFTPRTVDTIVLPPAAGRLFSTHDIGACSGVVLSREAARIVGGNQVVGRSIELPTGQWVDVIGVVATREPAREGRLYFYQPLPAAEPEAESWTAYRVADMPDREPIELDVNIVTSNYFDFMALPILAGRGFAGPHDACRVAVVNQQAADRYFGGNAVGAAIVDGAGRRTVIIGVVGANTLRVMQRDVQPAVYFPAAQDYIPRMTMIAETPGVGRGTLDRLHRRIATIAGGRDEFIIVTTLDRHLSRTAFAPERIATVLVSASTAIALVLGVLALYGVMSDAARRRQREFALRIALGAQSRHVMGQVVGSGMRQVMIGTVAGTVGAVVLSQLLASVAPVEGALSPLVWLAAPASLALALLMAGVLPARRALTSNPLMIMRSE
jgi:hypothetical protein